MSVLVCRLSFFFFFFKEIGGSCGGTHLYQEKLSKQLITLFSHITYHLCHMKIVTCEMGLFMPPTSENFVRIA